MLIRLICAKVCRTHVSIRARRGELTLNSVAVTAAALRRSGVQRIAIVDWVCMLLLALGREYGGQASLFLVAVGSALFMFLLLDLHFRVHIHAVFVSKIHIK